MHKIFHHLSIQAPQEKVFQQLISLEGLRSWWTLDTTGDPTAGGELRFGFGNSYFDRMKVTKVIPESEVVWEVIDSNFNEGSEWLGTTIHFELSEGKNGSTVLRFKHDAWREMTDFFGVCNFHWGLFLQSLKSLCEHGKGQPHAAIG